MCAGEKEEPLSGTPRLGTVPVVALDPHYCMLCVWEQLLLELRLQEEQDLYLCKPIQQQTSTVESVRD